MSRFLKAISERVAHGARAALAGTGIPYVVSFVLRYRQRHQAGNFAGNLLTIRERYANAAPSERRVLCAQFDAILDNLVLPNGVRKTTYADRQQAAIAKFLSEPQWRIAKPSIRVLDIPASSGVASLENYRLLTRVYTVSTYLLADVCCEVLYDAERGCIYDETGQLLQVKLRTGFFSVNPRHRSGYPYSHLTQLLLFPASVLANFFRKTYHVSRAGSLVAIPLVHPEVEPHLANGAFRLRRSDVFTLGIRADFDLILSFNLLQRNYFPPDVIDSGVRNLTEALAEGGYCIMGSTESFGISQKRGDQLVELYRTGSW